MILKIPRGCIVTTVLATIACGGRSPAAPDPNAAPQLTSVAASLPGGHTDTLVPGERIQLAAVLSGPGGVTTDCTSTAAWTSSDDGIAHFSARPGELVGGVGGKVLVSATCDGTKSAPLKLSVIGGVRVTGYEGEPFILPGGKTEYGGSQFSGQLVRLDAYHVDANGARGLDCPSYSTWSTSDPSVATTSSFPLSDYIGTGPYLIGHSPGTVTVTVNCDGTTGQTSIQVRPFRIRGVVTDPNGQPLAGVTVYVRRTNYPTVGDLTMTTGADGSFEGEWGNASMWLQAVGPPTSTTLRMVEWNRAASMTVDLTVLRRPTVILEGSGTICLAGVTDPACPKVSPDLQWVPVRPQINGPATVTVTWPGYPANGNGNGLLVIATCGNLSQGFTRDLSGSAILTWNASTACTYQVSFTNIQTLPVLPYRYRIEQ